MMASEYDEAHPGYDCGNTCVIHRGLATLGPIYTQAELDAEWNRAIEAAAGVAETEAGKRCLKHQQSGKGVCGYEIANEIRAVASTPESDDVVDEVQRRMDAVVDAAVAHYQADENWPETSEALDVAIRSLLELRSPPNVENSEVSS